jgi:hypothetical protein
MRSCGRSPTESTFAPPPTTSRAKSRAPSQTGGARARQAWPSQTHRGVVRGSLTYWKPGFTDMTLRLLGSHDFAPVVKAHAAYELTAAYSMGACAHGSRSAFR